MILKTGWFDNNARKKSKRLFGDETPSLATVGLWFNKFQRRRVSLKNEHRESRPTTAITPKNINAVRTMIKIDNHYTYKDI